MVRTLCFQCKGRSVVEELRFHMPSGVAKIFLNKSKDRTPCRAKMLVALEKQGEVASEGIQKEKGLMLWETSQEQDRGKAAHSNCPN